MRKFPILSLGKKMADQIPENSENKILQFLKNYFAKKVLKKIRENSRENIKLQILAGKNENEILATISEYLENYVQNLTFDEIVAEMKKMGKILEIKKGEGYFSLFFDGKLIFNFSKNKPVNRKDVQLNFFDKNEKRKFKIEKEKSANEIKKNIWIRDFFISEFFEIDDEKNWATKKISKNGIEFYFQKSLEDKKYLLTETKNGNENAKWVPNFAAVEKITDEILTKNFDFENFKSAK